MIGAARRFHQLMTGLLLRRELAGGQLSQDEESQTAAELERCWWAMTEAEQVQAEQAFSDAASPSAPQALDQLDSEVDPGSRQMPRKAAA